MAAGRPYEAAVAGDGGVHPLHRRRSRRSRATFDRLLRGRRPRPFVALSRRPRRARRPVAVRRPGLALPAHLRADPARRGHRRIASRPRSRRPIRGPRRRPDAGRPGQRRPTTENDSGIRPRSSAARRRGRPTSRSGARRPRSSRRSAPSSAVTTSPSVQARANFQLWSGSSRSTAGRCTRAPSPSTPRRRRSSRSRSRSSGRPRRHRTATRPDGPRTGRTDRSGRGGGR